MPNFKSISFKMAVLQGAGRICPLCVCYPKDPICNRVKSCSEVDLKLEVEKTIDNCSRTLIFEMCLWKGVSVNNYSWKFCNLGLPVGSLSNISHQIGKISLLQGAKMSHSCFIKLFLVLVFTCCFYLLNNPFLNS